MPELNQLPKSFHAARAVGSLYYFSGVPCKRGHVDRRVTRNRTCVGCYNARRITPEARTTAKRRYLKRYALTLEQYNTMILSQGRACAICGTIFKGISGSKGPQIDHDHATGKVRELLCTRYNTSIGLLENPDLMKRLNNYLIKHS